MFYDCAQPLIAGGPNWIDYAPISISKPYSVAEDGFAAERIDLSTHSGTHVDAPSHFLTDGATIDQLPIERFFGYAVAVDLRAKRGAAPIDREDLTQAGEAIANDDIVLIATGMGERRANTRAWLTEYPYLTRNAARFLVERGVRGVGTDAISIGGYGADVSPPPHRELLTAGVFIIEDMRIPSELLDGARRRFCAFPVKISGAGAAWARPVAWDT